MTNKINHLALFSSILAANFSLADQNITEIVVEADYLANNVANSIKSPTPVINVPQSVSIISPQKELMSKVLVVLKILLVTTWRYHVPR